MSPQMEQLEGLNASEKLRLIGELWDSIIESNEDIAIPQHHLELLNQREEEYRRNPERLTTWEAIESRLREQLPYLKVEK